VPVGRAISRLNAPLKTDPEEPRALFTSSAVADLAQLPATRKIRKLVFSAAEHMRTRALDAGASAFVVKPDHQKLQEALLSFAGSLQLTVG